MPINAVGILEGVASNAGASGPSREFKAAIPSMRYTIFLGFGKQRLKSRDISPDSMCGSVLTRKSAKPNGPDRPRAIPRMRTPGMADWHRQTPEFGATYARAYGGDAAFGDNTTPPAANLPRARLVGNSEAD